MTWPLPEIDGLRTVEGMRNLGASWGNDNYWKQGKLQLAVRSLRRFMFLVMLRAQTQAPSDAMNSQRPFVFAEGLYVLATAIMRFVEDYDWLQRENVHLRTNLSVALAKLRRFTE